MSIVDLVYQYRSLLGRCERGEGLEFDQIDELTQLEAMFRPGADDLYAREGRLHRRESVVLGALLRGPDQNDRVAVHDLSLGGLAVTGAPYANVGDVLEVVIDADRRSYRFKARVCWLDEDGDDYKLGLALVGLPLVLAYGPRHASADDEIERIANAA